VIDNQGASGTGPSGMWRSTTSGPGAVSGKRAAESDGKKGASTILPNRDAGSKSSRLRNVSSSPGLASSSNKQSSTFFMSSTKSNSPLASSTQDPVSAVSTPSPR